MKPDRVCITTDKAKNGFKYKYIQYLLNFSNQLHTHYLALSNHKKTRVFQIPTMNYVITVKWHFILNFGFFLILIIAAIVISVFDCILLESYIVLYCLSMLQCNRAFVFVFKTVQVYDFLS